MNIGQEGDAYSRYFALTAMFIYFCDDFGDEDIMAS